MIRRYLELSGQCHRMLLRDIWAREAHIRCSSEQRDYMSASYTVWRFSQLFHLTRNYDIRHAAGILGDQDISMDRQNDTA